MVHRQERSHGDQPYDEARSANLTVTGVPRDEAIGRFLFGSTVETLAGRSRIPLLVVRRCGLKPYRHVVTATEYSDASWQAVETGLRLFPDAVHEVLCRYGQRERYRDSAQCLRQEHAIGRGQRKPLLLQTRSFFHAPSSGLSVHHASQSTGGGAARFTRGTIPSPR